MAVASSSSSSTFSSQVAIAVAVAALNEGCPIHPYRNGPYKPCVDPYGSNASSTGVYGLTVEVILARRMYFLPVLAWCFLSFFSFNVVFFM